MYLWKNRNPAKLRPLAWLAPGSGNAYQVGGFHLVGEEVRKCQTLVQRTLQGDVVLETEAGYSELTDSQGRWSPAVIILLTIPIPLDGGGGVPPCLDRETEGPVESHQGWGRYGSQSLSKPRIKQRQTGPSGELTIRTKLGAGPAGSLPLPRLHVPGVSRGAGGSARRGGRAPDRCRLVGSSSGV